MKTSHICFNCSEDFIADKNTNIKNCEKCRKNNISKKKYTERKNLIIAKLNNNLTSIRINNTNGRYNINTNVRENSFSLENSIANIKNKTLYLNYLKGLKIKVNNDIKFIKSLDE